MATVDAAEGWALCVVNTPQASQDYLNAFEGKDGEAPRTDTHEQRVAKIAKIMSDKDTKINGHYRFSGIDDNSLVNNQTKKLGSVNTPLNDVRMLQIIPGNKAYDAAYAKIGGGTDASTYACLNAARRVKAPVQLVVTKGPNGKIMINRAPAPAPGPAAHIKPGKHVTPAPGPNGKVNTPPAEVVPAPGPEGVGEQPPAEHIPTPGKDKVNPGVAGVDRNPLTPDVPGLGLDLPPAPAPEPTPAPLVESGPEPAGPADTGDLTPPAAPPVQGNGADAPTPTSDVVINP